MDRKNMRNWLRAYLELEKKPPIPVLSFPCVTLMGITVGQLIGDSALQARGMALVAQRVHTGASVSMMDLSVEAEAFGAPIRVDDMEVPTVSGVIVPDMEAAQGLQVPSVGQGRTGRYVEAIGLAMELITDRPVFAGMIGPYSLAGRLMGVTEIMMNCYDEPEMVQCVMEKATQFLISYALAYKAVGASGVVMAEPLTGLLSPALAEEFSEPYVKRVVEAVQDDSFLVIYHNCGNNTVRMLDSLLRVGAAAYHFGNSVSMEEVLAKMPPDTPALGNVDPAGQFRNGTPASVAQATGQLLARCGGYRNFILSSGCDIPPATPWENIDAFFAAAEAFRP